MIYLDNAATTKPRAEVVKSFQQTAELYFANPSSIHELGGKVGELQEKAREQTADLLKVRTDEIIFTSGGTEGNNLAIKGIAWQHKNRGNHIITTEIEHASVYGSCKSLEADGFEITYLPVNDEGVISLKDLSRAITDKTILVSIMHVNNEIGSIQPIDEIGGLLNQYPKVFFHVDAVQGLGKVPLSLTESNIDLCTFSGHKIHGLKGTGILYARKGTTFTPLFHGGNQEKAFRSGTENVAGNVAFARALRLMKQEEKEKCVQMNQLKDVVMRELATIEGVIVNSSFEGAPHLVNVSVPGIKPETFIHALYDEGIIISTQSACASKQFEASRVLLACGHDEKRASSGLRISLTYDTSKEEMEKFLQAFRKVVVQLRKIMR